MNNEIVQGAIDAIRAIAFAILVGFGFAAGFFFMLFLSGL